MTTPGLSPSEPDPSLARASWLPKTQCRTHPSREAVSTCPTCGRGMCEVCAEARVGHEFCSSRCALRARARVWLSQLTRLLKAKVSHPMSIAVSAGAAALLITAIGILTAELIGTERKKTLPTSPDPSSQGDSVLNVDTVKRDGELQLIVVGPANARVALTKGNRILERFELDETGRGTIMAPVASGDDQRFELALLIPQEVDLESTVPPGRAPAADVSVSRPAQVSVSPPVGKQAPSHSPTPAPSARPRVARAESSQVPTPDSTPRRSPPVLHLVTDAGPRLAITFDGGSSSRGTPELLGLLREMQLPVTMFLTGGFIERRPDLVRQALLDGHEIGNHTYSHPRLTTYASNRRHELLPHVNRPWFEMELRRTEAAFFRATGRRMAPLWRAPYGEESSRLRAWALELGYLHVSWSSMKGQSLDSHDWIEDKGSPLFKDPGRTLRRLLSFPRLEGGLILMHVASDRDTPMWRVLPDLVEELENRGIEPVQVTKLLDHSPIWRRWLTRARQNHQRPTLRGDLDDIQVPHGAASPEAATDRANPSSQPDRP